MGDWRELRTQQFRVVCEELFERFIARERVTGVIQSEETAA